MKLICGISHDCWQTLEKLSLVKGLAMALALTRKNEEWYIPLLAKYSPAVCKVKVYWLYNFSVSKLCPQTVEGIENGDPNWQGFKKQDIKILWILKCFD